MAFRKRVFASAFKNGSSSRFTKRRKFIRKRRFTRSKRTTDYTSLNTRGTSVGFRGKKTSRQAYKRHIWNSTIFKTHWRSIQTLASGFATPASDSTALVSVFNMYRETNPFYIVAGGAIPTDTGGNVPQFVGDVILRGGKYELTVHNSSVNDVKIILYRMTTVNEPDFGTLNDWPADGLTQVPQAWDPTTVPNVNTQVGKTFMAREVTIEGGNSYTFVTRFKMQKVDKDVYAADSRSPYIIVKYGNVGTATANTIVIKRSYNLSFSGDADVP